MVQTNMAILFDEEAIQNAINKGYETADAVARENIVAYICISVVLIVAVICLTVFAVKTGTWPWDFPRKDRDRGV